MRSNLDASNIQVETMREANVQPHISSDVQMPRKDFYGLNLNWYAIDSAGRVGQFTAGYAPVPAAVFLDEGLLDRVSEYFLSSTDGGASFLSATVARRLQADGSLNYSMHLAEARKGVFVFGETGEQGAPTYMLEALPSNPVLVGELPSDVGAAVSLVRFKDISFPEIEVFEPGRLVPCER